MLTTTLTKADAWGREYYATIEWVPEDITHIDGAFENTGRKLFAHGDVDDPPATLVRDTTGGVDLQTIVSSRARTTEVVVEFTRVDSPTARLKEGEYRVVESTDDLWTAGH